MGWHGSVRSRIRYPLLANAVQRLLTAMVGQDREEANRLQQAKWELTSRIRDESNVPNAFHFSRRSPLFTRFRPSGSRRGVGDDGSGWVGKPKPRIARYHGTPSSHAVRGRTPMS